MAASSRALGGSEAAGLLDGWLFELFGHENVHFDDPDARADPVFGGHRDVRHDLLDEAVAFAEYVDRSGSPRGVVYRRGEGAAGWAEADFIATSTGRRASGPGC